MTRIVWPAMRGSAPNLRCQNLREHDAVFRGVHAEQAARVGTHAKGGEEARRHQRPDHPLSSTGVRQSDRQDQLADHAREDLIVVANVGEVAVLKRAVRAPVDADQPIGIRDAADRAGEEGVRDGVDRDVGAYAEGKREDRDGGESRGAQQAAERVSRVVHMEGSSSRLLVRR